MPADSAYGREVLGEDHVWGLAEQLLAATHDRLAEGNWQRGGCKGKRPQLIPRPGTRTDVKHYGGSTPYTQEQVLELLARAAGRPLPTPGGQR